MSILRIEGSIQAYAWGMRGELSRLLGREPSQGPEAEFWLGAHPLSPTRILDAVEAGTLEAHIAQTPEAALGKELAARTEGKLPFLFKVLAAAEPLSLQVHPNSGKAREGYAREEAAGLPLSAPHRVYRDPFHKPELLYALTPFSVLCGFLPAEEGLGMLSKFGLSHPDSPLYPAFLRYQRGAGPEGLARFLRELFALPREQMRAAVRILVEAAIGLEKRASPELLRRCFWQRRLAAVYPDDPGVVAALLLHLVELPPGQAVFLAPGQLHAYLGGKGLELMASSDNVLRGGLTQKHIDVQELLSALDLVSQAPLVLTPEISVSEGGARVEILRAPVEEFQLSLLEVAGAQSFASSGPEILLVLEGELVLRCASGQRLQLEAGAQVFCDACSQYELSGVGKLARAGVNRALSGFR